MQSIDALLFRLHELAMEFPDDERPIFNGPASEEAISSFQAAASAQLPDDFAAFLRKCDSIIAMDVWNGYWIGGVEGLLGNIDCNDFPSEVLEGKSPVAVVPIATDGGGNAFLLALSGNKVWKWNHESGDTELIAHGFTSFLGRIVEDWEHFLRNDAAWGYLSG